MKITRILAPLAAAVTVGAASMIGAGPASAHVSASAPTLTQGGYGVVTLVVPNESESSPTTSVRITLPNLKSARPEVMPGWKTVVTKNTDTQEVTAITWTADPGTPGVPVGQFAQFRLSGGPFPEQETVNLPALQTYADGEKVDWSQPTPASGEEPEHPAPTLKLGPATADGHGGAHGAGTDGTDPGETSSDHEQTASSASDSSARWLGGAGLVVGALGAVIAVAALTRGRRNGGDSDA